MNYTKVPLYKVNENVLFYIELTSKNDKRNFRLGKKIKSYTKMVFDHMSKYPVPIVEVELLGNGEKLELGEHNEVYLYDLNPKLRWKPIGEYCPKCHNSNMEVLNEFDILLDEPYRCKISDGDKIKCLSCEYEGEIDIDGNIINN